MSDKRIATIKEELKKRRIEKEGAAADKLSRDEEAARVREKARADWANVRPVINQAVKSVNFEIDGEGTTIKLTYNALQGASGLASIAVELQGHVSTGRMAIIVSDTGEVSLRATPNTTANIATFSLAEAAQQEKWEEVLISFVERSLRLR